MGMRIYYNSKEAAGYGTYRKKRKKGINETLKKTNCRLSFNAYSAYGGIVFPGSVKVHVFMAGMTVHFLMWDRDYPFWCSCEGQNLPK